MGWQIIRQPDGKLGVFSSNSDGWVAVDCDPGDVEELFAAEEGRKLARKLRELRSDIQEVLGRERRSVYYQFAMTYEEAADLAENGPQVYTSEDDGEPCPCGTPAQQTATPDAGVREA